MGGVGSICNSRIYGIGKVSGNRIYCEANDIKQYYQNKYPNIIGAAASEGKRFRQTVRRALMLMLAPTPPQSNCSSRCSARSAASTSWKMATRWSKGTHIGSRACDHTTTKNPRTKNRTKESRKNRWNGPPT